MISKLPRWIEIGGFCLTAIAGAVNAVGLLGFEHEAVSHLTGTTTLFGLSLVEGAFAEAVHLSLVIGAFVLGAMMSGALVERSMLRLDRRYSIALFLESLLLLLAMLALGRGSTSGHLLASTACGLQNGLVSTFSGATVRTTHVSGLFTDLGTMFGARIRGHPLDRRRVVLYVVLISGFASGSALGAFLFPKLRFVTLALPAGGALLLALATWLFHDRSSEV